MKYTIKIHETGQPRTPANNATIVGLLEDAVEYEKWKKYDDRPRQNVYLHFAHHTFATEWNEKTQRQDIVDRHTFYGGMGEGSTFDTWQRAILSSLYDEYQTNGEMKEGDEFEVTYLGETATFQCVSFHVVPKAA